MHFHSWYNQFTKIWILYRYFRNVTCHMYVKGFVCIQSMPLIESNKKYHESKVNMLNLKELLFVQYINTFLCIDMLRLHLMSKCNIPSMHGLSLVQKYFVVFKWVGQIRGFPSLRLMGYRSRGERQPLLSTTRLLNSVLSISMEKELGGWVCEELITLWEATIKFSATKTNSGNNKFWGPTGELAYSLHDLQCRQFLIITFGITAS